MEIKINLNDIFCDEDGTPCESVEEAIRRQIVDKMSGDLKKRLFSKMDEELSKIMSAQIGEAIKDKMPGIVDDIMEATYTPVSSYGQKGEPTNFRNEMIKAISANLEYKPKQWSSDESAFTKAVKSIVEQKTGEIRKALTDQIDAKFKADAITYAVAELSKRLGLTK